MHKHSKMHSAKRPSSGAKTWEQMQYELTTDVAAILEGLPATDFILGVIQWRGRSLAAPIYEACSHQLVLECAANREAVIPSPDSNRDRWQVVNCRIVDINGVRVPGNFPAFYFVKTLSGGEGVAFHVPAINGHRVQWSTQDDLIDDIAHCLVDAGLLRCVRLKPDGRTVEKR